jgi:hypothetical protein
MDYWTNGMDWEQSFRGDPTIEWSTLLHVGAGKVVARYARDEPVESSGYYLHEGALRKWWSAPRFPWWGRFLPFLHRIGLTDLTDNQVDDYMTRRRHVGL